MPIGPWPDFDACVRANQDKDDPEAFCAWLEQQMAENVAVSRPIAGKRLVLGVDVFAAGTWTDSSGATTTWTPGDLLDMVTAFQRGMPETVHVKLGHTSEEFNARLAEKLGIPLEALTGDAQGQGQVSLGQVVRLYQVGDKLKADLLVPEAIAEMVQQDMLVQVSSEVIPRTGDRPAMLDAIALLGAERPAVKDLDGLAAAMVLVQRRQPVLSYRFNMARGAIWITQEAHVDEKQVRDALGLKEGEDILAAIKALQERATQPAQFSEERQKLTEELKQRDQRIAALERLERLSRYREQVTPLKVEGKPEELAARLADLEARAGKEVAEEVLAAWRRESEARLALFSATGTARPGAPESGATAYERAVEQYRRDNPGASEADAHRAVMKAQPALYQEYRRSRMARAS